MATKEEILNYVDNTPENSNRNVLSGMLDNYGGSGGSLIVTMNNRALNKTWQEINDAFLSGVPVLVATSSGDEEAGESTTVHTLVTSVGAEVYPGENIFSVKAGQMTFASSSASDYPQIEM